MFTVRTLRDGARNLSVYAASINPRPRITADFDAGQTVERVPGYPDLKVEREMLSRCSLLAAVDEVGRGCVAGPVTVGVVLLRPGVVEPPTGVRDSKMLSEARRAALRPLVAEWAPEHAVAHSSAEEIDELGLVAALRTAALRAFAELPEIPAAVLLDGSHDWLSFHGASFTVHTRVKADRDCAAVAAASILAKTARDALIVAAPEAQVYGFASNKGYLTATHLAALKEHGPCGLHRRSWRVPGVPGFKQ